MCGERWSRDHKCAAAVQLHVVQEMFDVLGLSSESSGEEHSDIGSECHTISRAAVQGSSRRKLYGYKGKSKTNKY